MNIVMGLRYTASLVQKQQDCSQSSFALKAHNNCNQRHARMEYMSLIICDKLGALRPLHVRFS